MASEIHGAIDIGTNTVLLLIAEKEGQNIDPFLEEQRIPRLGKGVDSSGNLAGDSILRVIEVLKEYRQIINSTYSKLHSITVTATSAVRDAGNKNDFIEKVQAVTGFKVKVLNGEQEAEFTFNGALSVLPEIENAAVLDIGGGSTEIAVGEHGRLLDSHSFDMGSVRFTERFIKNDPPGKDEVSRCRDEVKKLLYTRPFELSHKIKNYNLIGVAGTVTSLAFIDLGLSKYDARKKNGFTLSRVKIKKWIANISVSGIATLEENFPEVMKGRAEVILAGLLILDVFMDFYGIPELMVSTGGIRHGSILHSS